jgi:TRAP-type C4-dicarboxylate transport system permease small subunit
VSDVAAARPGAASAAPGTDPLLLWSRRAARGGAWFGGLIVTLAAFVISVDVVLRKVFALTLGGASEISGYVLAVSTSWSLAIALLDRVHVRIDTLYAALPVRICALLDIVGLVVFMVFAGFVTWQGWILFAQSAELGSRALTPLETPLAIPQFLWLLGFAFFFVVMALLLVRALTALATGRLEDVHRMLGSRTAVQDLEEALDERARGAMN